MAHIKCWRILSFNNKSIKMIINLNSFNIHIWEYCMFICTYEKRLHTPFIKFSMTEHNNYHQTGLGIETKSCIPDVYKQNPKHTYDF